MSTPGNHVTTPPECSSPAGSSRLLRDSPPTRVYHALETGAGDTDLQRQPVRLIRDSIGVRWFVFPAPRPLVYAAGRVISLLTRDVVLTSDEIEGLTAGLCVSGDSPMATTPTKLSEWLTAHKDTLGRVYASEMQRHDR
ncbi:hypothetical protein [Candidatus Spongiisocius sp.]|uniref:hypothetical protein n=1 Tax=Candidatus Spongiisocius sp. TaxID=3101273 RepID=UPI003B59B59A